ncbi:hypothetical protein [Pedobacter sp. KLB.chiD]|uniref:hypothetical protein n=1 Tax=Pedobacter sp. KLB.chiD TaxID=3387402 RepID=UPI00399A7125
MEAARSIAYSGIALTQMLLNLLSKKMLKPVFHSNICPRSSLYSFALRVPYNHPPATGRGLGTQDSAVNPMKILKKLSFIRPATTNPLTGRAT